MTSLEITWPEPAPNWMEAKRIWKWSWDLYVFGFSSLYILVGFLAVFSLIRQRTAYQRKKKLHALFLNVLLIVFSSTRSAILFWNPYGFEDLSITLLVVAVILSGMATSCLTAAFSVLLLIVLDTTKISLAPPRFQKISVLVAIWLSNAVYLLISNLVVAHYNSAKVMIFVCQLVYALWGVVVAVGYAIAALRIRKNLRSSREFSRNHNNLLKETAKMQRLVTLLLVASVEGFVTFTVFIYSASGDTGVFNDGGHVEIWPWFTLKTIISLLELLMCAIIFLAALSSGSNERNVTVDVIPSSMRHETSQRPTNVSASDDKIELKC